MELPLIQETNFSILVGTGGKNSYLISVNSSNLFCFLLVQKTIYIVCVCAICYPKNCNSDECIDKFVNVRSNIVKNTVLNVTCVEIRNFTQLRQKILR